MTLAAILLLTVSAVLHAGWNLLSKRERPSASFFLGANTAGCLLFLPLALLEYRVYFAFPPRVWALAAAAGFCMAVYYIGLAGAYRNGDMSVAYPLARSSPILVVIAVTFILGRGSQISPPCVAGIVLVVAGCFLVPLRRFRDFHPARYITPTCALAFLAAVGTAGYSILDDEALRLLRNDPALGLGKIRLTLLYAFLEVVSANLCLLAFTLRTGAGRRAWRAQWRERKGPSLLAGLAIYGAYSLVLVAMAHARNVSYVVAFRQLSIPLGAAAGMLLLREPHHAPRLAGLALICAGLALVALG